MSVWPKHLTLGPRETTRFLAFGLISQTDSIPAVVTWSASTGTITPDGEYTAGSDTGQVVVTAVHAQKLWLADSSAVSVSSVAPALTRLWIWPRNATRVLGDSLDVWAFGITSVGDTTLVDVSWRVEGGSLRSKGRGQGLYKPDHSGRHTLTASADSLVDTTTVTVTGTTSVARVDVTPSPISLSIGGTAQLTATPRDSAGNAVSGRAVSWSTSSAGVATVSGSGMVTAVAQGTATITAACEGRTGSATVTVTVAPVASVSVSPASLGVSVGQTTQLTATTRDSAGNPLTGRAVTWTTSAAGVAAVNGSGLVTAVALGTATITATSEGRTGSATVTVTASTAGPLAFASDWSTAPGTSATALGDGGRWNAVNPGLGDLEVVSTAGLDFPAGMANAIAFYLDGTVSGVIAENYASEIAEGQTRYWRVYQRMGHGTGGDNLIHHLQMAPTAGSIPFWFRHVTSDGPTYRQSFEGRYDNANSVEHHNWSYTLNRNATYRIEWSITRLPNDYIILHVRIYDSAGTLVASDADLACDFSPHTNLPHPHYLTQGSQAINNAQQANANGRFLASQWAFGSNDLLISNPGENLPGATYYGGLAVSDEDWCGPYVPGEGG